MSFGGLAQFPLRLGAASETNVSPEQWTRLSLDVCGLIAPLAVLIITEGATDGPCAIVGLSRGGGDMSQISATRTTDEYGISIAVDIGPHYHDTTDGEPRNWTALDYSVRMIGFAGTYTRSRSGNSLTFSAASEVGYTGVHQVVIWGATEQRWPGDYGADLSKAKSTTEGEQPYAWAWLQECQAMRGDAFSIAPGSFTQIENLASARFWALIQRCAERHAAQQLPGQADQRLGLWQKLLDIGTTDDRDWQIRRKAAAKYALTIAGPSEEALEAAAVAVFGANFVEIHRFGGDLLTPADNTFWPAGVVGPGSLDLGGGPWSTMRQHLVFELTAATTAERVRLLDLAHRDMDDLIVAALAPVMTWAYSFNAPGGFILGTSELGREVL